MNFLSVCSGIEAASVAWQPLGWKAAAFSEIEPFPCSVLSHHYPNVPNLGDMTKFKEWPDDLSINLLCGGTPCQSFSVAGLRKGLSDPRGNLMLTYLAIAAKYRPKWVVWENVPGVLSSWSGADETGALHEGQDEWEGDEASDFSCFLAGLEELGYGWAFRSFDAQFAGLAQRRERVFVVGCLGDWHGAAAVLLERHSLSGHLAPRRQAGQRPTGNLSARTEGGGGLGTDFELGGGLIAGTLQASGKAAGSATQQDAESGLLLAFDTTQVTSAANRSSPRPGDLCRPLAAGMHAPAIAFPAFMSGTQHAATADLAPAMGAENQTAVAYSTKLHNTASNNAGKIFEERTACLDANSPPPALLTSMQVRRLTPRECERLQGFPDDYTLVPHRGKPAADGPRYKALGNSWAVPCAEWIGRRIQAVDGIANRQLEAA